MKQFKEDVRAQINHSVWCKVVVYISPKPRKQIFVRLSASFFDFMPSVNRELRVIKKLSDKKIEFLL